MDLILSQKVQALSDRKVIVLSDQDIDHLLAAEQ